jgi:rubrerythrin
MEKTGLDEPQPTSAMEELARDPASRRRFLSGLGGSAAAGSFALFLAACGSKKKQLTPGGSDPKTGAGVGTDRYGKGDLGIAIYALTLEYVEIGFYEKAIAGGKLTGRVLELAKRFAAQEAQHAKALEAVVTQLGGKLPQRPVTKFSMGTPQVILQQAVTFENLGAGAYLGQAGRIQSKELLGAALSIHSVEARHAAALSVASNVSPTPDGAFGQPQTAFNVITAIQPNLV